MNNEQKQIEIAKILGKINALKFGLFTLSSGKLAHTMLTCELCLVFRMPLETSATYIPKQ